MHFDDILDYLVDQFFLECPILSVAHTFLRLWAKFNKQGKWQCDHSIIIDVSGKFWEWSILAIRKLKKLDAEAHLMIEEAHNAAQIRSQKQVNNQICVNYLSTLCNLLITNITKTVQWQPKHLGKLHCLINLNTFLLNLPLEMEFTIPINAYAIKSIQINLSTTKCVH